MPFKYKSEKLCICIWGSCYWDHDLHSMILKLHELTQGVSYFQTATKEREQGTWLRESEEHSLLSNSPPGIQTTSLLTGNKLHSPSDMRKSEKGISFFFFFCCMACAILVPWPGVKPLQQKCSLNHGTTRKVLRNAFKNIPQGLAWGSHG